jgi:hypothetical protein
MKKRNARVTLVLRVEGVRVAMKMGGSLTVPLSRGDRSKVTSLLEDAAYFAAKEAERPGGAAAEIRRLRGLQRSQIDDV